MLFGKKAQDAEQTDDTSNSKYGRLQKQDEDNRSSGKSNHVEEICRSKGRELHHDRANMNNNKDNSN